MSTDVGSVIISGPIDLKAVKAISESFNFYAIGDTIFMTLVTGAIKKAPFNLG